MRALLFTCTCLVVLAGATAAWASCPPLNPLAAAPFNDGGAYRCDSGADSNPTFSIERHEWDDASVETTYTLVAPFSVPPIRRLSGFAGWLEVTVLDRQAEAGPLFIRQMTKSGTEGMPSFRHLGPSGQVYGVTLILPLP